MFAMGYLPPDAYPNWKEQLRQGNVVVATAGMVGRRLGRIHSVRRAHPGPLASSRPTPPSRRFGSNPISWRRRARIPIWPPSCTASPRRRRGPGSAWCMAMSARRTSSSGRRAGLHRCRMRLVWRPGLRPCLLPQPPAAEMFVGTRGGGAAAGFFRRAGRGVSGERRLGARRCDRGAGRQPAAGAVAGAGRRQVSGRISDRGERQGDGPPGGAVAAGCAPDRLAEIRRSWANAIEVRKRMAEAQIARIVGRRVWDSRGRPTVEAEVFLDRRDERARHRPGRRFDRHPRGGRAARRRPGLRRLGVDRAVANVNSEIAAALRGMPIADQAAIDRRLIAARREPEQGAARRQCDYRRIDGGIARGRRPRGTSRCGGCWPKAAASACRCR